MLTNEWLAQLPVNNIIDVTPVSGGDINEAYQVKTVAQDFFLKVQPQRKAAFFAHEVEGLNSLQAAANVPKVIATGEINTDGYLLLEWLETGIGDQFAVGQMVAHVHLIHSEQFGYYHDFNQGRLPKNNSWNPDWLSFYLNQRLIPLIQLAQQKNLWNPQRELHFQRLVQILTNYYQKHPTVPSLLHGDLWAGNFLFASDHTPYLIDPDCFYGDREMDIAMTTVFDGFDSHFYDGYNSVYPLSTGWQDRLLWYQFYYLLSHLNLFGEEYGPAVDHVLANF